MTNDPKANSGTANSARLFISNLVVVVVAVSESSSPGEQEIHTSSTRNHDQIKQQKKTQTHHSSSLGLRQRRGSKTTLSPLDELQRSVTELSLMINGSDGQPMTEVTAIP
jgi:hypothetical protein